MKVFEFDNYRKFLQGFIASRPRKGWGYVRRIADHLRINPVQVSQVLSGVKDLTIEQALSLSEFMELSRIETDYFVHLVSEERAGSSELKKYYKQKLKDLKTQANQITEQIPTKEKLTEEQRAIFYSDWLYSAIRLYSSVDNGKSLEQICKRFSIDRERAIQITRFLVSTGLCQVSDGIFIMGVQRTVLDRSSPFLPQHHTNWRLQAIQKSRALSEDELIFTSPVSLNETDFKTIKKQILDLIRNASERVKESPAKEVACLNIDWFWISS